MFFLFFAYKNNKKKRIYGTFPTFLFCSALDFFRKT